MGNTKQVALDAHMDIYPRGILAPVRKLTADNDIGIFDPNGGLQKVFELYGLDFTDISSIIGLQQFTGDVVLFGPGALGKEAKLYMSFLKSRIDKGMNIVIFAHDEPYQAFGQTLVSNEGVSEERKGIFRAVNCAPGHPLVRGFATSLSNWRGDGIIAQTPAAWPRDGNFRLLLEGRAEK
ncbi:MAG: hypothetical protein QGD94_08165, partial [Planctomycetia bacterium]|nr:hypothetical protein [Planctomycetia bacterium]